MKKQIDKEITQIEIEDSDDQETDSSLKKEAAGIVALEEKIPSSTSEGCNGETHPVSKTAAQLTKELDQERDRRMRIAAEYENYRRRTQAEYSLMFIRAAERIITSLLPVLDDFSRLVNQDQSQTESKEILKGAELIQRKLVETLRSEGLFPIETVGETFNAEIHEAIAEMEDPTKPPGTILNELEKGYMLGETIIRHPKVVVNRYAEGEGGIIDEQA